MWPSMLCAQRPAGNRLGWKSSGHLRFSTRAAPAPAITQPTQLADTSNNAPPTAFNATRVALKCWGEEVGPATSSHASGPSESTVWPARCALAFGCSGNGTPSKRSASETNDDCAPLPRTSHASPNETSPRVTPLSDTKPLSASIDKARRADLDLHFHVGKRRDGPQRFAVTRTAARHERECDPRPEVRAETPRRDVPQHRVRQCVIGIRNNLCASRYRCAPLRRKADQMPAIRRVQRGTREQRLSDAPLARIDELLHPEIGRRRAPVDLRADHHVALFDPQG